MTELLTDLDSHKIEGFLPGNKYINIPLISEIEDNLWVGGCIGGVTLPEDFEYVVSLYMWEQYALSDWTRRITVKMYDSPDKPDATLVLGLGNLVHTLSQKGKTLVHCQAGINRSNLIAATALVIGGRTPEEAIALLREKRSEAVLANRVFEDWLLEDLPSLT